MKCSSTLSVFAFFFFFSSRRRHTRWTGDWSSDVCSSDLESGLQGRAREHERSFLGDRRVELLVDGEALPVRPLLSLGERDRKSTRLNSSHPSISYAVFCLKKKKKKKIHQQRRRKLN